MQQGWLISKKRAALAVAAIPLAGMLAMAVPHHPASAGTELACERSTVADLAEQVLNKYAGAKGEPGVTLAVYLPLRFRETVSVARGFADFEAQTPISPESRMLAGSIGKTMFAAAALNLADQQRLDLDVPISTYLGAETVPQSKVVTTRMLLSHTSGYGEYDGQFMRDLVAEPRRERTLADWTGPIRRNAPANPGKFRYSDINFVLLAAVIEAASGLPAEEFIAQEFLRPYDLDDTGPSNRIDLAELTTGYAGPENFFGRDAMIDEAGLIYNPQFESGGGGFYSNAPDLARWITLFSVGNLFSKPRWQEALAPIHVDSTSGKGYGLGIHVDPTPLGTAYGHSGYIPGYYSWARWYPEANVAVAIQTNTSDDARAPWDGYDMANELAASLNELCN